MSSADLARRPKRQAARNKIYTQDNVLRCNPALYVGYVEDLETPEMISTYAWKIKISEDIITFGLTIDS